MQNCIIVGAGDVGQLLGRKILQHPEYGINLVGFVDANPKELRPELEHTSVLGTPDRLPQLVALLDVERVIVAFSKEPTPDIIRMVRALREFDIQVDIVPRLFDVVGPKRRGDEHRGHPADRTPCFSHQPRPLGLQSERSTC